ncbi:hypothetical protein Tco_0538170, partial [Tanacetum coccineum]
GLRLEKGLDRIRAYYQGWKMDRDVAGWVWRNDNCLPSQAAGAHISKMAVTKKTLRSPLNIVSPILDVIKELSDLKKTPNVEADQLQSVFDIEGKIKLVIILDGFRVPPPAAESGAPPTELSTDAGAEHAPGLVSTPTTKAGASFF